MRIPIPLAVAIWCTTTIHAQWAVVTVSHDDHDGLVEPGQTVRIHASIEWGDGFQVAGLAGDLNASPNLGIASNVTYGHSMGPTIFPGSVSGASLLGYDVASLPPMFIGGMPVPPWYFSEFELFSYDWTAPSAAGQYEFGFEPRALAPNVRIYTSLWPPLFAEANSTYAPASLTVVPAPASALVLGSAGAALIGRRRRP